MENNFEIIDNNGTIHSGDEIEMIGAFEAMTLTEKEMKENGFANPKEWKRKYECEFSGDLKLVKVIAVRR